MANKLSTSKVKTIQSLRKKCYSLNDIVKKTGFAKSTVSLYCKDVEFDKFKLNRKNRKSAKRNAAIGTMANKKKWHDKRQAVIERARDRWREIKNDPEMLALVALCWAEGCKRSTATFRIANTDPGIINAAIKGCRKLSIASDRFRLRITIYEGQSPAICGEEWAKATGIKDIRVRIIKMRSEHKLYSKNGVCHLRIKRPFEIFHTIITWIKCWRHDLGVENDGWQL